MKRRYFIPELWLDEPCKDVVLEASDTGLDLDGELELGEE